MVMLGMLDIIAAPVIKLVPAPLLCIEARVLVLLFY
jgi:hypothetical protein